MPIDASIPLGYKPVQTPNMLAAAAQGQEMSLNALKMQEAMQSIADREFVKSLDPSAPDYINRLSQRLPEVGAKVQKSRTEARTAELDQRTKIGTLLKTSATPVIANPTLENAVMALQNFSKATGDDVTSEFNALQKIGNNPEAIKKWAMGHALTGDQILAQTDLSANQKAQLGIQQGQLGVSQQTLANANNPVLQESLAAAKASGTTKGKATATAQLNLPNAIATSEDLVNKIDAMVGKEAKIDKNTKKILEAGTAPHKGFTGAVGMGSWKAAGIPGVQQYVPGSAAADFKSRYDEIMGGAFLEAFETLKGGGSITETEGKKATAAKTRMNLAQSEGEFLSAAREYQGVVRRGIERAKAKAASGGSTPAGGEIDFNSLK